MSKVMIDYWGISETLHAEFGFPYRYQHPGPSDPSEILVCKQNFLTALVLWDEIYLNSDIENMNERDESNRVAFHLWEMLEHQPFVHTIPIANRIDIFWYKKFSEIMMYKSNNDYNFSKRDLLFRSSLYLAQAINSGITYLPHPFRAKFFKDSEIFRRPLDPRLFLDIIDDEVRNYINAINKLAKYPLMSMPFPVLYEFISRIAKDPLDEFKVALDLRNDKNISLFRESINEITEEFEKENLLAVKASLLKVKEICDEITNSIYKKEKSYGVSIGASPAFSISWDGKLKISSGIHTTFLSDLAKFSFKGDIPDRYLIKGLGLD